MSRRLTKEQFIKKSIVKHGDNYDYSLVEYINDRTPVLIICPSHGEFRQLPNVHYRSGCAECGLLKRSNSRKNKIENLISSFKFKHGEQYDYSQVQYNKMRDKIKIRCKKHDFLFLQTPEKHLESKTGGCGKCNSIGKGKMSVKTFIEKANEKHSDIYDYTLICSFNYKKKVSIICKKHGVFEMSQNAHLRGQGCRNCNRNGGKIENIWLDTYNIPKDYRQFKIGNFFVDGVNIHNKLVYEFYGDFWHGNPKVYNSNDVNRVNGLTFGELYNRTITRQMEIEKIGYKVISIWESDFKKQNNIL
jgi:very-short-patch-repair endonuclease